MTIRLREALSRLLLLLANRDIRRLERAWTATFAGEFGWVVALLVYAYATDGFVVAGIVGLARTLPAALASPFLAALADRMPRHRVLLLVTASRALLVGAAALVALVDGLSLIVYALAVVDAIVFVLYRPAHASLLPALARNPGELCSVNVVASTGEGLGALIGPAAIGVLLALTNPGVAMLFCVAAWTYAALETLRLNPSAGGASVVGSGGRAALVFGGLRALRSHPTAGLLVGLFGLQTVVRGALGVLLVVAAVELLGMGEQGAGYLAAAIGAGGFLGAVVTAAIAGQGRLAGLFAVGLVLWGIPIALTGILPHAAAALAFLVVLGAGNAVLDVSGFTLLQRLVPNEVRARVFGALEGVAMLSVGVGAAIAPILIGLVGIQGALVLTGLVLPVAAALSWSRVSSADARTVVPEQELGVLGASPIFAPLPLTVLEQLAGGMRRRVVPAGTLVVRQGERGDRCYLIERGAAEVRIDDRPVATLGRGDTFGEIALLRDVPRVADVTALEELIAYELDRDVFLAAVTGNPTSSQLAAAQVNSRLARSA